MSVRHYANKPDDVLEIAYRLVRSGTVMFGHHESGLILTMSYKPEDLTGAFGMPQLFLGAHEHFLKRTDLNNAFDGACGPHIVADHKVNILAFANAVRVALRQHRDKLITLAAKTADAPEDKPGLTLTIPGASR